MPDAPHSIRDRISLRVGVPSARGPLAAEGAAEGAADGAVEGSAAGGPARRAHRLDAMAPALVGGAAGFLAFLLVRGSLIDDAYITLCYARNLAFHGQWALVAGHPANTATSPLNVLLLALAAFVTRHPVFGLGLVFAATCAGFTMALDGLFARLGLRRGGALCAALLVIGDPLLLSTVGMEVMLVLLIAVATLRAALAARPVATGLLCAAMMLTRPDAAVIVLVLVLAIPATRRRWRLVGVVAALAAAPWYLFSWVFLGAVVPDSIVIKAAAAGWSGFTFGNGLFVYFERTPGVITISLAAAVLGLLWALPALVRPGAANSGPWRRPLLALAGAAAAHFGVLALAAPQPFHWYYGPSVGLATVVFGGLCSRPIPGSVRAELSAALLCCLAAAITCDFVCGLPWHVAPVSTNWATSAAYAKVGRQLGPLVGTAGVGSPGEVGEIAYFCDCDIVDPFSNHAVFMGELAAWNAEGGTLRHDFVALDYHFANHSKRSPTLEYVLQVVDQRPARGSRYWIIGTPWTENSNGQLHYLELVRRYGS